MKTDINGLEKKLPNIWPILSGHRNTIFTQKTAYEKQCRSPQPETTSQQSPSCTESLVSHCTLWYLYECAIYLSSSSRCVFNTHNNILQSIVFLCQATLLSVRPSPRVWLIISLCVTYTRNVNAAPSAQPSLSWPQINFSFPQNGWD